MRNELLDKDLGNGATRGLSAAKIKPCLNKIENASMEIMNNVDCKG